MPELGSDGHHLCYSAVVIVLSKENPRVLLHHSIKVVLTPRLPDERNGTVSSLVFPTGLDQRNDLGIPDRCDAHDGMAKNWIGVGRFNMPEHLPPGVLVDSVGRKTGGHE